MATTDCLYGSRQGHKYGTDGFFYSPSVPFRRELLQYSCAVCSHRLRRQLILAGNEKEELQW
ncbi:MAG: hypothetical protein K2O13_06740 [Lachnospiraceae bacterium]|nr:hypothetical protein [Lachnospiraceae bacterium]